MQIVSSSNVNMQRFSDSAEDMKGSNITSSISHTLQTLMNLNGGLKCPASISRKCRNENYYGIYPLHLRTNSVGMLAVASFFFNNIKLDVRRYKRRKTMTRTRNCIFGFIMKIYNAIAVCLKNSSHIKDVIPDTISLSKALMCFL